MIQLLKDMTKPSFVQLLAISGSTLALTVVFTGCIFGLDKVFATIVGLFL